MVGVGQFQFHAHTIRTDSESLTVALRQVRVTSPDTSAKTKTNTNSKTKTNTNAKMKPTEDGVSNRRIIFPEAIIDRSRALAAHLCWQRAGQALCLVPRESGPTDAAARCSAPLLADCRREETRKKGWRDGGME
eukprot:2492880-Rhodomonas_salina.1